MAWLGAAIFFIFGLLNINDPDWFIWVPTYWMIAIIPTIPQNTLSLKNKISISVPLFIVGSLIFLGILDTSFYYQADNMMTGLLEYQREGVGLLLGSFWIYLQKYL
tara:strand:+ start:209 stop:526 length:318 start_codon:yes stop_codon:yes gene_type:complete